MNAAVAARLGRAVHSRWLVPVLILTGLVLRCALVVPKGLTFNEAEAGAVAVAFAKGRGLADAYFAGSGPTAHFLPTAPVVAGTIYLLFGVHTTAAELMLIAFAFAQLIASTLLTARLFTLLGAPRAAVLGAIAWSMIVPTNFQIDTLSFRVWDNGLAFIAVLVCLIDQVEVAVSARARHPGRSAIVLAVAAFANPVMGAALAVGVFAVYWRAQGLTRAVAVGGATLLTFAAISAPWVLRNERTLGAPIVSRSNAGLELALADHDAALGPGAPAAVFDGRHRALHPYDDGPGRAAFRRLGEPGYQQALARETMRWIAAHPAGFATLAARHVFRTITPQAWQITTTNAAARAATIGVCCWTGIVALAWLVVRDRGSPWWIPAAFIALALIGYAPFQPMYRYIYPFYQLLLFCAATGIGRAVAWLRGLNSVPARDT